MNPFELQIKASLSQNIDINKGVFFFIESKVPGKLSEARVKKLYGIFQIEQYLQESGEMFEMMLNNLPIFLNPDVKIPFPLTIDPHYSKQL